MNTAERQEIAHFRTDLMNARAQAERVGAALLAALAEAPILDPYEDTIDADEESLLPPPPHDHAQENNEHG